MANELLRFWGRIKQDPETGCWEWTGAKDTGGYGRFMADGRLIGAHQWSYRNWVGQVPDGAELDHLCRNRACANWQHLEPVTRRENQLRGDTVSSRNAVKTHCVHGHEFTPENTYVREAKGRRRRECRACSLRRATAAQAAKRNALVHAALSKPLLSGVGMHIAGC